MTRLSIVHGGTICWPVTVRLLPIPWRFALTYYLLVGSVALSNLRHELLSSYVITTASTDDISWCIVQVYKELESAIQAEISKQEKEVSSENCRFHPLCGSFNLICVVCDPKQVSWNCQVFGCLKIIKVQDELVKSTSSMQKKELSEVGILFRPSWLVFLSSYCTHIVFIQFSCDQLRYTVYR